MTTRRQLLLGALALFPRRSAGAAPASKALETAQAWLIGLRGKSAARMEKVSTFPLSVASVDEPRGCGREITRPEQLLPWVRCLRAREPALFAALARPEAMGGLLVTSPANIESDELRALVQKLGARVVAQAFVSANGLSYEVALALEEKAGPPKVRAFFFTSTGMA